MLQSVSGELNYIGECRDGLTGRCDECQGDCDEDADCMAGLVCFQREDGESIPGCAGGSVFDIKDKDYCTYLIALYYISILVTVQLHPFRNGTTAELAPTHSSVLRLIVHRLQTK